MRRFPLSLLALCCWLLPAATLTAAVTTEEKPTLLVMGDSLSAGFGLDQSRDWVSLLQTRLREKHFPQQVINASISGETSSGGLSRLPQALQSYRPQIVVIELGANDGLRGLPLTLLQQNLQRMIELAQQSGARVLLIGMRLPPNYGPAYTDRFQQLYRQLANDSHVALVPFLLDGVATRPELMQDDGLHPLASAQAQLLDNVWPQLLPLLTNSSSSAWAH
jgi:acyl-CoA thioesterase-1